MDTERPYPLDLELPLTTSEPADYLGVRVQAISDTRCGGQGPVAIHVGKGLRYRTRDVRKWLDGLQETVEHSDVTVGKR